MELFTVVHVNIKTDREKLLAIHTHCFTVSHRSVLMSRHWELTVTPNMLTKFKIF